MAKIHFIWAFKDTSGTVKLYTQIPLPTTICMLQCKRNNLICTLQETKYCKFSTSCTNAFTKCSSI